MQAPQLVGLTLGMFGTVIGSVVTYYGLGMIRKAKANLSWPSVEGRIVRSEIITTESWSSSLNSLQRLYSPEVEYEYTVPGQILTDQMFTGENIKIGITGSSASDKAYAERYLAKYPVGKTVPVFFDPSKPQDSILEPGPSGITYAGLAIGLFFMVIGPAFGILIYLIF
jgi:hypothetical protein